VSGSSLYVRETQSGGSGRSHKVWFGLCLVPGLEFSESSLHSVVSVQCTVYSVHTVEHCLLGHHQTLQVSSINHTLINLHLSECIIHLTGGELDSEGHQ